MYGMTESLRPQVHVRAGKNWINDPNGPIFWNGAYHLFFQHNPRSPDWGPPNWGHAVSIDLVRWTVLDDALTPTPGGPDHGGCWSGCTVPHAGQVCALYTGVDTQGSSHAVCAAVSDGDLTQWRKLTEPVIPGPPPGMEPVGFRDPYVLRHGDGWLCVMGAGVASVGGSALLYRSDDLVTWEYVGPLYERDCSADDPIWTGEMWECPQFFPLGDRYLLGISVWHAEQTQYCAYFLGDFDGTRFSPTCAGRLDFGPDYYAATSMRDPRGRQLMWGWSWEALTTEARRESGLAGCLTVPRVVTLQDETLLIEPAEELAGLRGTHVGHHAGLVSRDEAVMLAVVSKPCYDVELELVPDAAQRIELELHASGDGRERTVVYLDISSGEAGVDTTASTLATFARTGVSRARLPLQPDQPVRVRVLADGSILEVFIDGQPCAVRPRSSPATSLQRSRG